MKITSCDCFSEQVGSHKEKAGNIEIQDIKILVQAFNNDEFPYSFFINMNKLKYCPICGKEIKVKE